MLVGATNAVNLTDGLDGLAISVFAVAAAAFTALAYVSTHVVFADYLQLVKLQPGGGRADDLLRRAGRREPRVPLVELLSRRHLHGRRRIARPRRRARHRRAAHQAGDSCSSIVGGVFVMEALSVIIQVGSFKLTGKRVFRMAPHPPPLRADRLERAEGHHAVRHPRDHLRAVQPHDVEAAMTTDRPFSVRGKRVTVAGAARSGVAAAELLVRRGATVTLSDVREQLDEEERLRDAGVELELGGHHAATFTGADLVVVEPRRPARGSRRSRRRARAGVPVIGELELASRWLRGRIVAITGTKGKSTTTTLTGRMLEAGGHRVLVGGNIGLALSAQVDDSTDDTIHVVEASSFQLEATDTFHPWIAVLLNFSPDHLDRHADVEEYAAAKARIFAQADGGRLGGAQRRRPRRRSRMAATARARRCCSR